MRFSLIPGYIIAMLCCIQPLQSQVKWDGEGGDGQWSNTKNWKNDFAPTALYDVILDNSIVTGSYTVTLPATNTPITIKSLIITPDPGKTIQCILPSGYTTSGPALIIAGPGGIVINNGGIFQNAGGGSSSGNETIAFSNTSDSLRINNGGKYWHNTFRAIGDIVKRLCQTPGTENGTFEIETPGGTGTTTIPLTNRVFGNLVFSGAQSGIRTYTIKGNTITITGTLTIKPATRIDIQSDPGTNIIVKGNYIQNGGVLNLANNTNSNTFLKIAGNVTQSADGQIAIGSGPGMPYIELNGTVPQNISLAGALTGGPVAGTIEFRVNNPSGVTLLAPLSLSYNLYLLKGQVTTSSVNLLTLQNTCGLQFPDSSTITSFINGPLRKEGLSAANRFLFPVGKNNMHRWLELRNATGSFTVEYHRSNPYLKSSMVSSEISNLSGLEYWTIKGDGPSNPSALIKLSFDNNSGGITNLSKLLIARLNTTLWTSIGQSATTGTATTNGSITALTAISNFNTTTDDLLTLATNISQSNPLPLKDPLKQPTGDASANVLFTKLQAITSSSIQGAIIQLTVLSEKDASIRIIITNQQGQPQKSLYFSLKKGSNKLTADLSSLFSGIYQLTGYTTNGITNTLRWIKPT